MPCFVAWQASCRRRRRPVLPSSSLPASGSFLWTRRLHRLMHSMSFYDAIATLNEFLARPRSLPPLRSSGSTGPSERVVTRFNLLHKYIEVLELQAPLSHLSVIHVAGTKGKGSTCAFTESILRSCGYRTALFTSPHLVDIRERFRFNGDLVSEELFAKNFWWCWDRLQAVASPSLPMPWFFSFLTLLALKMFTLENVDVAILEVGVGGLYDATNIIQQPSVCGIASLGYDHMDVLGNTLAEIATQKAGIFKAGVPAFSVPQLPEAMEALHKQARRLSVPLKIAPPLESYGGGKALNLGLDGDHQRVNAALAVALCFAWEKKLQSSQHLLVHRNGLLPDAYLQGLSATSWPGRGQIIQDVGFGTQNVSGSLGNCDWTKKTGRLTLFLDGAHTPESLEACAKWFSSAALKASTYGIKMFDEHLSYSNWCTPRNGHVTANNQDELNRQRVLLFSCMPKRDPELLFPCLIKACAEKGLPINLALFVPPLSSTEAIETRSVSDICSSAMEAEPNLSWQITLQRTWESLQNGSNSHSSAALAQLQLYLKDEKHSHLFHHCVLGRSSAVMPSLPASLKWLRCWALQNSVELQVLVTGSLYLVGDMLKICEQGQLNDI